MSAGYKAYVQQEVAKLKASGAGFHSDPQVRMWAATQGIDLKAEPGVQSKNTVKTGRFASYAFGVLGLVLPITVAYLVGHVMLADFSTGIQLIGAVFATGLTGVSIMCLKDILT